MEDKNSKYAWLFVLAVLFFMAFLYFNDARESMTLNSDGIDLYQPPNYTYYNIPDFTKWPIKKEGNIDADGDGKDDFKLTYYLKDKEDAVALFSRLDNTQPRLLMFAHYPENSPTGESIFYGIYENNKWDGILFPYPDLRINSELKILHIKTEPLHLAMQAFRSNFNRRGYFFLGGKDKWKSLSSIKPR